MRFNPPLSVHGDVSSVLSPFNAFEVNSILHHFPEGAVKKGEK